MKKKELFVCEYCGTDYSDQESAVRCENNHKSVKIAVKSKNYEVVERFQPFGMREDGYPVVIRIKEKDTGKEVIYKRM